MISNSPQTNSWLESRLLRVKRHHHTPVCIISTCSSISVIQTNEFLEAAETKQFPFCLWKSHTALSAPTVSKYKRTHFEGPAMSCCCSDTSSSPEKNPRLWCMPRYFTHPHSQIYLLTPFHSSLSLSLPLPRSRSLLSSFYSFSLHFCVSLSPCFTLNLRGCQQRCGHSFTSPHLHMGSIICLCTCLTRKEMRENKERVQQMSMAMHCKSHISHPFAHLGAAFVLPRLPHAAYRMLPHTQNCGSWRFIFNHQIGPEQ